MNEVSTQTASLLVDSVEHRGLDCREIWQGLGLDRDVLRRTDARIDWETWVALIARVEQYVSVPLDDLFVPGIGARGGHPFVQIANGMLSLRDCYALFARWGIRRGMMVVRGTFEAVDRRRGRFELTIDSTRAGSLPTMRFMVGLLRHIPHLQGYPPAQVTLERGATDHHAVFALELPGQRSLLSRARRLVSAIGGARATLAELAAQANEIASKNIELERQLSDVRERDKWLELALEETRDRDKWLDVALAAGRIGLWRWDPSIRRVRLSSTLAEWLGVPGTTEVDTTVWGRLVHPEDQATIAKLMADALEHRIPFEAEYRVCEPHGHLMWFHIKGRVEVEPDGRVYAYGSTVDVTDKRLMDTRLRLADRLIAAGTLAAGVAHEINNPLTYVIGSLDLIQRRLAQHPEARDVTRDLLAQAFDGIERIRAVVADIRTFARHDDNAIVPVDLQTVCAAAIRIVSSDIRHRATLVTDLAADTPPVLANDSRLGQVLINLLVNASQAMPVGRPESENQIVVRTRRLPTGDAALEVEDNGTGIPPEVASRVFDPFFTTKPVGVGTGLGLSVCQGIVSSLGGRIDVDSRVGRGSRFTVILKPAAEATPAETVTAAPPTSGAGIRVLLIDDEPMIRNVVARSLAAQGFAVDEAVNGRDGLARAMGDGRYDAILCDLMMPDVDGVALHEELTRTRPDLARRIVFISGGAITARTRAFLSQPDVVVFHKPFAFERLVEAIERAAQGTSTSLPLT